MISENYRNTHTVDIDYTNEYLNVSVLDNDNQNSITEKFINEETKIKDNNYLKDFFTIIPSVYALHVGNGTYTTINIEGKQYALLTKEQLQGHSYKIIGAYYENYNCDNLTGYWTVKVLTSGIHNQRFNFSGQIADAHNLASAANVTTNGSVYQFIDDVQADFTAGVNNLTNSTASPGNVILANTSATSNNYVSKGNFTSRVFDANASVNWTALAFSTDVPYQRDLEDLKNASTVLLMHFNNDTGESERQLNETHTISNEGNLVLYMPFDSANARELVPNGSTVLLMHFNFKQCKAWQCRIGV
ncbi:hypothetical protein HYX00_05410 [Candidatus Woesearchaeota archaeon]|nr:hypothetical protein [Candidatus Woesearchaeota archaeon]